MAKLPFYVKKTETKVIPLENNKCELVETIHFRPLLLRLYLIFEFAIMIFKTKDEELEKDMVTN